MTIVNLADNCQRRNEPPMVVIGTKFTSSAMLKAYAFTWGERNEEASLGMKKKKKVSHNRVCVRASFVQNLYLIKYKDDCIVRFEPKHEAVYDNLVRFSKTCVFPCPVDIRGDFTKMRDGIKKKSNPCQFMRPMRVLIHSRFYCHFKSKISLIHFFLWKEVLFEFLVIFLLTPAQACL